MNLSRLSLLGLALPALLAVAAIVRAEVAAFPFVRDPDQKLRPVTREHLSDEIREIRRLYHRDVYIDILGSLGDEERKKLRSLRGREETQWLEDFGRQRAQAEQVDGVHLLVCFDPRRVVVTVWPETEELAYSKQDAEKLRKSISRRLLLTRLGSSPDRTLLDAVDRIKRTLRLNLHRDNPERGPVNAQTVGILVGGGLGLWFALRLAGRRGTGGLPSEADQPAARSGMLGVLFGTPNSIWIYDRLLAAPHGAMATETVEMEPVAAESSDPAAPRWPTQPVEGPTGAET